ncbi:MAG: JAB domain-containing protein [Thermotogota bacterium]|nr:JAB domain-containing protein [Thermotogota bacterium]
MILQIKELGKEISDPLKVASIIKKILALEDPADQNKEHFWTIGVNNKNQIIYIDLTHLGTLNKSIVHPRDVFRQAISHGVCSIIVVHNHPSGNPEPSKDDLAITEKLKRSGEILDISCLDHIIIGDCFFYSFNSDDYSVIEGENNYSTL